MSFIKTNFIKGYIYIRNHQSYGVYNACKIGKTSNLLERDKQYATGEIRRGYFEAVFEVFNEEIGTVEHLLKHKFREYNVKENAGTEFYKRKIVTLIEPCLIEFKIEYKRLSKREINDLLKANGARKIIQKIEITLNKDCVLENSEHVLKKIREVLSETGSKRERVVFKIDVESGKSEDEGKSQVINEPGKSKDRSNQKLTYQETIRILAHRGLESKESYFELCKKDNRFPEDPKATFSLEFSWREYLSIKGEFYDLETCKIKSNEYIRNQLVKVDLFNLIDSAKRLKEYDSRFPPFDLWIEFYDDVNDYSDVIGQDETTEKD